MVAAENGVDVLAEAISGGDTLSAGQVDTLRSSGVALVPALARSGRPGSTRAGLDETRRFAAAGGSVLFGTAATSTADSDPTQEFRLLAQAGLDWRAILRSLTTAPAERLDLAGTLGRILGDMNADLCVLEGDPSRDLGSFTRIRYTIGSGRLLYDARSPSGVSPAPTSPVTR
jgi:imidazolonepropionase-like amidohydrolase